MEATRRVCLLCGWETEADDEVVNSGERTICLRCYRRETDDPHVMPPGLRKHVEATLRTIE